MFYMAMRGSKPPGVVRCIGAQEALVGPGVLPSDGEVCPEGNASTLLVRVASLSGFWDGGPGESLVPQPGDGLEGHA